MSKRDLGALSTFARAYAILARLPDDSNFDGIAPHRNAGRNRLGGTVGVRAHVATLSRRAGN